MSPLEKLAFESQHYELGGGKIRTVFGGNRPSTMTMAKGSGLTPKQVKNLNHWVASKEVTDPEELKAAAKILMRENKGRLGGKPLFGRKRRNYSQLEAILAKKVEKTAAKRLLITKLATGFQQMMQNHEGMMGRFNKVKSLQPPPSPRPKPPKAAVLPKPSGEGHQDEFSLARKNARRVAVNAGLDPNKGLTVKTRVRSNNGNTSTSTHAGSL